MRYEGLKYFDICRQELKGSYQFYFDAFDIIRILQGVNRFYKDAPRQTFDHNLFNEEDSLIHALAFGKFLTSNIKLLPTHQAELTRVIKDNNTSHTFFSRMANPLRQFLETDLKFFDKLKQLKEAGHIAPSDNAIKSWINEKNKEIFKATFLSYKANYTERLAELFKNGVIQIEQYSLDDIQIDDYSLFMALSDAFKEARPHKEEGGSNFNDVAALMYLARKVKEYNDDNREPLPIYFDSHHYAGFIPGYILDKHFTIRTHTGDGRPPFESYALRSHDFFRVYALLTYNSFFPENEDRVYWDLVKTAESADDLQKSFEGPGIAKYLQEVGDWYNRANVELREKIENYVEVDFFKAIIDTLQKARPEVLTKILTDFDRLELNPDDTDAINTQNEIFLEYIQSKINVRISDTVNVYHEILQRVRMVSQVSRQLTEANTELDIFYHYTLFRFMIPKKYQASLRHFFSEDGLLSNDPANPSRVTLWNFYYRTVYQKSHDNVPNRQLLDTNELYLLYGSFWILNLHDKLIDYNTRKEDLEKLDHSLLMLIGACIDWVLVRQSSTDKDFDKHRTAYRNIIEVLEGRLVAEARSPSDQDVHNQIKIVLSYLYFHLWTQEGNIEILSRGEQENHIVAYDPTTYNYIAVKYAKEAFEYFEKRDVRNSAMFLYLFNIYMYYVIDGAPDEEFRKLSSRRNEFITLSGNAREWHYRYDDTIARNFHRLSRLMGPRESKLEYISKAIEVLQDSLKKQRPLEGKDVNEVRAYLDTLMNIKGELQAYVSPATP